jgi:hypothetical protein
MKCSGVLQCSDGLSNKASNVFRRYIRQYEVPACMYFTIITFVHILYVLLFLNVYMVVFLFNTVIYVFLLLCLCVLIVRLCIFIVPTGTLRLPLLRYFRGFLQL